MRILMIRTGLRSLMVCISLLVVLVGPASAQVVATSFDELQAVVKQGDIIDVTDLSGRHTKGRLGDLSASSLELLVRKTAPDGRETFVPQNRFSEGNVQHIRLERRDSLLNGTLIGLAAGAGPFLLAWPSLRGTEVEIAAPLGALIGGAVGAGTGAAIDALIRKRTTVFQRPLSPPSSGLQVSPLLSQSTTGIHMSLTF